MSVNAERGGKPQRVVNFMGNKISKPPESINAWEGNSSGGWRRGAPHTSLPSARPSHPARPGPRPGGPGGPGQPRPAAGAGGAGLGLGRGTLAPPGTSPHQHGPIPAPPPHIRHPRTDGRMAGRTDGATARRSEAPALCPIPVAQWGPRAVPAVTLLSPCHHPAVTLLPRAAAGRCWHPVSPWGLGTGMSPCGGVPQQWGLGLLRQGTNGPSTPRPVPAPVLSPSVKCWCPVPVAGPSPVSQSPSLGPSAQFWYLLPAPSARSQHPVPSPSTQSLVPAPSHWCQHPKLSPSTQYLVPALSAHSQHPVTSPSTQHPAPSAQCRAPVPSSWSQSLVPVP